jgi:hypothetical protein
VADGESGGGWYDRDIFGNPIDAAGRKQGRPVHVPTAENRQIFIGLCSDGHNLDDVAAALCISKPTLKKHYRDLCDHYFSAKLILKAQMLQIMISKAQAGSHVAAGKVLDRLAKMDAKGLPAPQKSVALGKKEKALIAASNAGQGTDWADLLNEVGTC